MPRDLFGDVTRPSISIGNRKWYTVPVSLLSHSIVLAMIVVVPILAAPMMPSVFDDMIIDYMPAVMPPPPPAPVKPPEARPIRPEVNPNLAPTVAPTGISEEKPEPEWRETAGPSIVSGDLGPGGIDSLAPPPPPPPPSIPTGPVRVGGTVRRPVKVKHVDPVYPQIALMARVQGIVVIDATLSADGRVVDARVLSSEPLLKQAALDAVSQWQFTPTTLNGVPVPVIMTVSVIFSLK